jgi:hypothetical protein
MKSLAIALSLVLLSSNVFAEANCAEGAAAIAQACDVLIRGNGSPSVCETYLPLLKGFIDVAQNNNCEISVLVNQTAIDKVDRLCTY